MLHAEDWSIMAESQERLMTENGGSGGARVRKLLAACSSAPARTPSLSTAVYIDAIRADGLVVATPE